MNLATNALLALLAVMVGLSTFRNCFSDEIWDLRRLVKAYEDLTNALKKKCEAQEELIET